MTRASSSQRHLFGLAPSGVCLAIDVTINAVVSYTAFSPLPNLSIWRFFSVALSRGLPRVGVTHHFALRSPDFPRCSHNAVTQTTLRPKDTGSPSPYVIPYFHRKVPL